MSTRPKRGVNNKEAGQKADPKRSKLEEKEKDDKEHNDEEHGDKKTKNDEAEEAEEEEAEAAAAEDEDEDNTTTNGKSSSKSEAASASAPPLKTKASSFAALKAGKVLSAHEFIPKALGPQDLAVDVTHCGVCHSDIHKMLDEWSVAGLGHTTFPLVPGHEVVGHVVAVGDEVKGFSVGDRVGMGPHRGSCLTCTYCKKNSEELCPKVEGLYDPETGGYANHLRIHHRFAFHIPKGISSEHAAPLLCAGVTVFSPLDHFKIPKNGSVGIVGVGGLGHLGIQFAKALKYKVTAISTTPGKEAEAKTFGAAHFLNSGDQEAMKKAEGTFDFILNTASGTVDLDTYLSLLKPDGNLCIVGIAPEKLRVASFSLVGGRKTLSGSMTGGTKVVKKMLKFAEKHKIFPKVEVVKVGWNEAEKANEVIEKVLANQVRYRAVFEYVEAEKPKDS